MYRIEINLMTRDNKDTPHRVGIQYWELMGAIFNDRQVVMMRDKKYPGSYF